MKSQWIFVISLLATAESPVVSQLLWGEQNLQFVPGSGANSLFLVQWFWWNITVFSLKTIWQLEISQFFPFFTISGSHNLGDLFLRYHVFQTHRWTLRFRWLRHLVSETGGNSIFPIDLHAFLTLQAYWPATASLVLGFSFFCTCFSRWTHELCVNTWSGFTVMLYWKLWVFFKAAHSCWTLVNRGPSLPTIL